MILLEVIKDEALRATLKGHRQLSTQYQSRIISIGGVPNDEFFEGMKYVHKCDLINDNFSYVLSV